jgi:membrane-bound serine protease (ClpP class)
MIARAAGEARYPRSFSIWNACVGFLLASCLLSAAHVRADEPAGDKRSADETVDGLFVTVPSPIDTLGVNRVKAITNRFLDRADHRGLKIVYDFNPDNDPARSSDYGTCRDLAVFLLDLQDVTTVAFVHNDVTGHTVLPVLACQDIVMSRKARLGNALRGQSKPVEPDQIVFYKNAASRRRRPEAAVLKMLDKNVHLPGVQFDASDAYDAEQAEKFGLCDLKLETRQELKDAYRLPTSSLREDPLQGRTPNAWRIVLTGPVNRALMETIVRRTQRAISKGANLIIYQLECGGGETEVARDLADFFRTRVNDIGDGPVMTVGYVTDQARDTAIFLALGCTEIVMDKNAHLGGFEKILRERPDYAPAIAKSLEDLAEKQGYPGLLARGMLDSKIAIHRVSSRVGKLNMRRFMDEKELEEDRRNERRWQDEGEVKKAGQLLVLDSRHARDADVAKFVFDGKHAESTAALRETYGLDQIKDAGPDWLDEFAEFLCKPVVSVFLVMIGIAGLILELKIPGVGFPGVVAALCFVLYFWAHHDQMRGHLTMLAVLLFILGLILIALEIFVVPGLGVTGISGIVLIVLSLGLVTLVKKPETTQEWMDFGATLTTLGFGLVGSVGTALLVAWYLPHIPYANRLMLAPPSDGLDVLEEQGGAAETPAALLGAIGVAATALRPAGKAQFADDYLDVVAEGSYVQAGVRVQIIEIEGNRIVVKEV